LIRSKICCGLIKLDTRIERGYAKLNKKGVKMNKVKKYNKEFREEAIKLVTESGYSQAEAARSLGISGKNISRWIKDLKAENSLNNKKLTVEQEEIRRLNKENQRLKMEREILKKAAAFFANERA
jgi:transposase